MWAVLLIINTIVTQHPNQPKCAYRGHLIQETQTCDLRLDPAAVNGTEYVSSHVEQGCKAQCPWMMGMVSTKTCIC